MGRPKDAPNKNKRGMAARLKEQYGEEFDVIMMMGENCQTLHKIAQDHRDKITTEDGGVIDASNSAKNANDALDRLAQYVTPKLKAIEHTGGDGEALFPSIKVTHE